MRARGIGSGLIFVVSGPSGSGKTTLIKELLKDRALEKVLAKSISLTTRPQRCGEREGRDYFFVSNAQFQRKLKLGKVLEWTKYLGHYYGTPKDFIEARIEKNKSILLCLDLKGAQNLRQVYPRKTTTIFIQPPSLKELKCRIEGRCLKTKKEEIQKRLKLAQEEVTASGRYDYAIVNNNLEAAKSELKEIILKEIMR